MPLRSSFFFHFHRALLFRPRSTLLTAVVASSPVLENKRRIASSFFSVSGLTFSSVVLSKASPNTSLSTCGAVAESEDDMGEVAKEKEKRRKSREKAEEKKRQWRTRETRTAVVGDANL